MKRRPYRGNLLAAGAARTTPTVLGEDFSVLILRKHQTSHRFKHTKQGPVPVH
jgi:hypothetical protein